MQLQIDVLADPVESLQMAVTFLTGHIALRVAMEGAGQSLVPTGTLVGAQVPQPPMPSPEVLAAAMASAGHPAPVVPTVPVVPVVPQPPSNVTPFPMPPLQSAATATAPASSIQNPILAAASVYSEWDKSGVPWDARIHQATKGVKANGTWKLKKGIDPALAESVMRELASHIRIAASGVTDVSPVGLFGKAPLPVGADAPVTLPGNGMVGGRVGTTPGLPVSVPGSPFHAVHAAQASTPVPPPPAESIQTPGAQGPGVDPYRALVTKINTARQQKKLTPEEITQCVAQAGGSSLSTLNNTPHLIATVDMYVDALLATR